VRLTRYRVGHSVLGTDIDAVQTNLTRPIGRGCCGEIDGAHAPLVVLEVCSIPVRSVQHPASSVVSSVEPLVLLPHLGALVLAKPRRLPDAEEGPVHLRAGRAPPTGVSFDRKLAPTHQSAVASGSGLVSGRVNSWSFNVSATGLITGVVVAHGNKLVKVRRLVHRYMSQGQLTWEQVRQVSLEAGTRPEWMPSGWYTVVRVKVSDLSRSYLTAPKLGSEPYA
jgi:hypothetical protein